jgi:subtilisin-like proprotein convertase family protein
VTRRIVVALAVLALPTTPAQATDFSGGALAIPDSGSSTPYPSTITVSGATHGVDKVTVRLSLTHDLPEDIDAMLVGPRGQAVMLMSDVGSNQLASATSLRFDDAAAEPVPDTIVAGTFRPTNEDGGDLDAFPAPAPATSPGGALSAFKGTDPNGTWSLYVVDDEPGDSGAIGSWTLSITDAPRSVLAWAPAAYAVPEAAGSAAVTITRAGGALPGSVSYATAPMMGFTTSAVAGTDYVAQRGTLAFAAGQTSATLTIPILDDVQDGLDKPFRIHLSGATGDAGVSDPLDAVVTILDDDAPPALAIADVRIPEHSATGLGELVVGLSAPSERLVTAHLTLTPGTANAGTDYEDHSTSFSIPAGTPSVAIAVRVRGDKLVEHDETFTATLSDVVNATLGRAVATATIVDDDKPAPPSVSARVTKRGALELAVTSNFDGVAVARAQVSAGGRSARLTSPRVRVVAGRAAKLTLHLPPAMRHARITARVAVTVSHGATKQTARRTLRLRT